MQDGLVLVHGSELGSWSWERLLPQLQSPALAVDLLGRPPHEVPRQSVTLVDTVATLADDVRRWRSGPVVLVAHSFAGVLVPAVAARLGEQVRAVVLLGAAVPRNGKSWLQLQRMPARVLLRALYAARPAGVLSPAGQNRALLCNDLDEATTERFLRRRVPEAPGNLTDVVPTAAFPPVPLHVVHLTADRTTDARNEQALRDLPGAEHHELDSGHLPMLSRPTRLAALLDGIAAR